MRYYDVNRNSLVAFLVKDEPAQIPLALFKSVPTKKRGEARMIPCPSFFPDHAHQQTLPICSYSPCDGSQGEGVGPFCMLSQLRDVI